MLNVSLVTVMLLMMSMTKAISVVNIDLMTRSFLATLVRTFIIRTSRLVTCQVITDGPSRVYCGMGYAGLSYEDV